nr:GIY-YIG nuclease family protein [Allobaculum sp. Allo2]
MLCCRDGTFYTGSTNRLPRRLKAHNQKKARGIREAVFRSFWSITKSF